MESGGNRRPGTEQQLREVTVGSPVAINGPIRLVPYDSAWPDLFDREAIRLRNILGDRILRLEHIGSTSISPPA